MTWVWFLVGLAILGLLAAVWGICVERHLFVIRRESLRILPTGSQPIRVLHIGDLHIAPWQKRKLAWISKLGELSPDLVVNTGDNLGHTAAIGPTLTALRPLLERTGVFVNGSNDYYAPVARNPLAYLAKPSERSEGKPLETARLVGGFTSSGWLDLNNRQGRAVINGVSINFVGVDDAHDGLDDLSTVPDPQTLASGSDLVIGVSHAPYLRVIDSMAEAGVDLMFAGHTHGGQVCVPGFGALVTNCDLPRKNAKGLSSWKVAGKTMILNVTAGLGHSIYAPVRFACRPEVRLLTLLPKS
jgi:predicted MPP superfamily phosphohydrolase